MWRSSWTRDPPSPADVVLEVAGLIAEDQRHQLALRGVDLSVRAGEVLGVAGVQGNGQTELVEVLTGLRPAMGGSVRILGQDMTNVTPRTVTELGVAHIPEDRQEDGLVLSFPVSDNLMLYTYYQPPFAQGPTIQFETLYEYSERLVEEFDVRTPGIAVPAQNLSGGNQQKVIVAREFSRPIQLAHCRSADARAGRRLDRVHPPPAYAKAGRGYGRAVGLGGTGRDHGAV